LPRIFGHVEAFAAAARANLALLRVVDPEVEQLEQAAIEQTLADIVRDQGASATITVRAREERQSAAAAIAHVATQLHANLIAVDSRDLTMLRHAVRGSTAMDLVAATRTPVMVASSKIQGPRASGDYHLVVTSDGSAKSDAVIDTLQDFMNLPTVRFTLLQLYVPTIGDQGNLIEMDSCEEHLEVLRRRIPSSAHLARRVDKPEGLESVPHAILRIAADLEADVLVMATQGATAARHVLVGSVALAVTQHAPLPVVLARV
jgi:nucleotide-binding universal stress UspA family protein